jgi:predicted O-methyltransferase YrrM
METNMAIELTETDFMTVDELKSASKWPIEWTSTKGLVPYIKRQGDNLVGLEIGTCRAESTYDILSRCDNVLKLYTIDPYKAYEDWAGELNQEVIDKFLMIAEENLKSFGERVQMIRETSLDAASKIKTILNSQDDTPFDFIFVDGDHSYEATLADCEAYYPLLKKGGIFCGHDYSALESVHRAVDDFREKNKITAPINLTTNSSFFWYK